jgi:hypothetical protein
VILNLPAAFYINSVKVKITGTKGILTCIERNRFDQIKEQKNIEELKRVQSQAQVNCT